MAENKTRLQRLTDVIIGTGNGNAQAVKAVSKYTINPSSEIIYSSTSKEERDKKLKQLKQERLMAYQWAKGGYDTSMSQIAGASQAQLMYRDADLMAMWPEIYAALSTYAEEACTKNSKGKILNIYSKSDRIKAVLEDLFVNRLNIHIMLPLIVFSTVKYGNTFMQLNIGGGRNGILGWRTLPVHEIQRVENGMNNIYGGLGAPSISGQGLKPDEVQFVWQGHNESMPYKNWQVAHFRLITDSLLLPYGVSILNGARRHWRMLSMMEDSMLIYRLERSIERRIFKVNVGAIGDEDVPAFLQEFMNGVKRAPMIDPETGQVDLRKNFLDVNADYVIPVRNGQDPSSIDTLNAATNQTSIDDMNYMENKVLAALRIPKSFLNFKDSEGKQQNLSLIDIRFNRVINRIQEAILMELQKVAIIHLYLLGFEDELTNFSLSMNNPSNQIEMMEIDNLTKRIAAATNALQEMGGGIPLMSWHQVQREIMGKTDKEISEILSEIRFESAIALEIQKTGEIIKRTHTFDNVDNIYGEPGAKYSEGPANGEGGPDGMGGGGGAPMLGGDDFGEGLDNLGAPGEEPFDIGGEEGGAPLEDMGEEGSPMLSEKRERNLIFEKYMENILKSNEENEDKNVALIDKTFLINENLNNTISCLEKSLNENLNEEKPKKGKKK